MNPFYIITTRSYYLAAFLAVSAVLQTPQSTHAGSATWLNNPTTGDWNTAANWMPNTIPNGNSDIATFAFSDTTEVSLSAETTLDGITYQPGASPFTISINSPQELVFRGVGVNNNSGIIQNFVTNLTDIEDSGVITFHNNATAGNMTVYTNNASSVGGGTNGGATIFRNNASAGSALFINKGAPPEVSGSGGRTEFYDNSTAASGVFLNYPNVFAGGLMQFFGASTGGTGDFTCYGGQTGFAGAGKILFNGESSADHGTYLAYGPTVTNANPGAIIFNDATTADHGAFTAKGGTVAGEGGGAIFVFDSSTAAEATFVVDGGTVRGAGGGELDFNSNATAGNATIIVNGGENGGYGGDCQFAGDSNGGTARVQVYGNGTLTIFTSNFRGPVPLGSIEGDGKILLGSALQVGGNNLSTTFSGVIRKGIGSLTKVGSGTLTLTGPSNYREDTTVKEGGLTVTNRIGSATGKGAVHVEGGILAGTGIIRGAVTIGTGGGAGAFLTPAAGASEPAKLTIQSALTLAADSTYTVRLDTEKRNSDQVVANGVTILSGAQFQLNSIGNGKLPLGRSTILIKNTSANPIAGVFANLPDGSTITAGRTNFQVSYTGGDGNDLTLTVVP